MSYDFYLNDPVTHARIQVPGHMMHGGIMPCEHINGQLVPTTTTEAHINMTYNYSRYYYEALPSMNEDEGDRDQYDRDAETYGIISEYRGVRSICDMSGAQAVPLLEEMIRRIEDRYKGPDGWIATERTREQWENVEDGSVIDSGDMLSLLRDNRQKPEDEQKAFEAKWKHRTYTVLVNEGDTDDYWAETAANAIRPLYQLIALSRIRPDGIWSEES